MKKDNCIFLINRCQQLEHMEMYSMRRNEYTQRYTKIYRDILSHILIRITLPRSEVKRVIIANYH